MFSANIYSPCQLHHAGRNKNGIAICKECRSIEQQIKQNKRPPYGTFGCGVCSYRVPMYSAQCKNLMKIFQSQKTRQMKWAWNCSVLLVILAKMQIFKANFQPDGRKMQKNFISKSFSKRLKKFANVGSLAEGWRLKKLFRFL